MKTTTNHYKTDTECQAYIDKDGTLTCELCNLTVLIGKRIQKCEYTGEKIPVVAYEKKSRR